MASAAPLQINVKQGGQTKSPGLTLAGNNPAERAIELSKRSLETQSLDELLFLLTNDTRTLIEFERSWLVTHLGGSSRLAATNNQPTLNDKSAFVNDVNNLATVLQHKDKALFLSSRIIREDSLGNKVTAELKEALKAYMEHSGFSHILIMPLVHNEATVGHLAFEFEEGKIPREDDILAVLNVTPVLCRGPGRKITLGREARSARVPETRREGKDRLRATYETLLAAVDCSRGAPASCIFRDSDFVHGGRGG